MRPNSSEAHLSLQYEWHFIFSKRHNAVTERKTNVLTYKVRGIHIYDEKKYFRLITFILHFHAEFF